MTTAPIERPEQTPSVTITAEQTTLIKQTIAQGATDAELKLFFYDCTRRGVHPLDRLIHFTKRKGKYTPITSIDFMRGRAAETGEMAGSDDAAFVEGERYPVEARVTVWRLTQGQRFPYSATARWEEYYPGDGDVGFMWRKMPKTMLGKCAEALALRKAFPQQLQGLYAREEMDQAGTDAEPVVTGEVLPEVKQARPEPIPGAVYIDRVTSAPTKNKNVTKYTIALSDGRQVTTINQKLSGLAEQLAQAGEAVVVETQETKWGVDLVGLHRAEPDHAAVKTVTELPDSEIPF